MRFLDLFCGAGGAAVGMHRAFPKATIVGIDNRPQPHYPFTFIQGDALNPSVDLREFDFIWASPPCQAYVWFARKVAKYKDLIPETREMLRASGVQFVIENVVRSPIKTNIILCGAALGLTELSRHRVFESSQLLFAPQCQCRGKKIVSVYGSKPDGRRVTYRKYYRGQGVARSLDEAKRVMGIDWMTWDEIREAIPPAYSEYILRQFTFATCVSSASA